MLDALEFTARIRPKAINADGDDMPEDLHHGHTVRFDASRPYFELRALDDRNHEVTIPLTLADLNAIYAAHVAFIQMREATHA